MLHPLAKEQLILVKAHQLLTGKSRTRALSFQRNVATGTTLEVNSVWKVAVLGLLDYKDFIRKTLKSDDKSQDAPCAPCNQLRLHLHTAKPMVSDHFSTVDVQYMTHNIRHTIHHHPHTHITPQHTLPHHPRGTRHPTHGSRHTTRDTRDTMWHDTAWHNTDWHGRRGTTQHGTARHITARQGQNTTQRGTAQHGPARRSTT